MTKATTINKENNSKVYTLYYAFFLIPLMLTMFGVMFFFVFKVLTYETNSPTEYLNDVQYGAATKRWQSAFELSKLLSNPKLVPQDDGFKRKMIAVYEHAIHDDPTVRMYLALAMGRTNQTFYGEHLLKGLQDTDQGCRLAAIKALGNLAYLPSIDEIIKFTKDKNSVKERLAATIALGNMEDNSLIPVLQNLLSDEEPNVRWDSAIALAKLGDTSGSEVIANLLDRTYYKNFIEVDEEEKVQAIIIAIQASSKIPSDKFINNLMKLAAFDNNMEIRNLAIKTLDKTYNRKI